MDEVSRRALLAATAAGGIFAAATNAGAQPSEPVPQPQRPGHGGTDPGPRNLARDRQNPDLLVPPSTDSGTLPNLRFSFSDAHMRQTTGGWTRQVTVRELGISKDIAGVDMRLNAGSVRELHWHKEAEWTFMRYGSARITAIEAQGQSFVDDVDVGDLCTPARRRCGSSRYSRAVITPMSRSISGCIDAAELVKAHLKLDMQAQAALHREKYPVVPARSAHLSGNNGGEAPKER